MPQLQGYESITLPVTDVNKSSRTIDARWSHCAHAQVTLPDSATVTRPSRCALLAA